MDVPRRDAALLARAPVALRRCAARLRHLRRLRRAARICAVRRGAGRADRQRSAARRNRAATTTGRSRAASPTIGDIEAAAREADLDAGREAAAGALRRASWMRRRRATALPTCRADVRAAAEQRLAAMPTRWPSSSSTLACPHAERRSRSALDSTAFLWAETRHAARARCCARWTSSRAPTAGRESDVLGPEPGAPRGVPRAGDGA